MHTYTNPFHSVHYTGSKSVIETQITPQEYKGHLIFKHHAQHFDIVQHGVLISQYAGPNGARQFIDSRM